jgi:hypothetical protein
VALYEDAASMICRDVKAGPYTNVFGQPEWFHPQHVGAEA